jgi:hypothetical protein
MKFSYTNQTNFIHLLSSRKPNIKLSAYLVSSLAFATMAIVPFTFTPPAQASSFSSRVYGPNGSAERTTAWGANGAVKCANGIDYGVGSAAGCRSTYSGQNGSYQGYHVNGYNAQTENGYYNADRNATYNGNSYGYSVETNYTYTHRNGINSTTSINTQNNGSYTCSFSTQSGCSH